MQPHNGCENSLDGLSRRIRLRTLRLIHEAKSSHIGSAFSMADLLAILYAKILRVDPAHPDWPERDRFILSKGHACAPLYVTLAERGFFPRGFIDPSRGPSGCPLGAAAWTCKCLDADLLSQLIPPGHE